MERKDPEPGADMAKPGEPAAPKADAPKMIRSKPRSRSADRAPDDRVGQRPDPV